MSRLNRFEEHRFIGTRDDMVVHDCDDTDRLEQLKRRVDDEGLLAENLLQAFAPDTMDEARNRGFHPA